MKQTLLEQRGMAVHRHASLFKQSNTCATLTMHSIIMHRIRFFVVAGATGRSVLEAINHIGEDVEALLKVKGLLV